MNSFAVSNNPRDPATSKNNIRKESVIGSHTTLMMTRILLPSLELLYVFPSTVLEWNVESEV